MKTATTKPDMTISRPTLQMITKEVKETLAFGYPGQHKIFSSVDLWNIQRNRKGASKR